MTDESKRRDFLKYAGLGVTAGLAGCTRGGAQTETSSSGGNGSNGTGGKGASLDLAPYKKADIKWRKFDGQKINIGVVQHPWVTKVKPLTPVFEKLTGIDVVWNILPEQQFRTKRLTDVSTGAGKFDAFFMDQVVNQFRRARWLQPLDPYFRDGDLFDADWYDTKDIFEVCRAAGHGAGRSKTWTGMPITVEVLTTFYRKDLYKKHNLDVPKTTDDLVQNAKVIQQKEDGVVGGVGRGQKGYGMNIYIQNAWIREFGTKLWKDYPKSSALDSQAAIEAGQYYVNLLQKYGPPSAASMTWSDALSTMQQGKAGHFFADANLFWGNLTDPSASQIADSVGIAKMPTPTAKGGRFAPNSFSWQLSTSKAASHSKAAFLFMIWATSKPTQRYIGVTGTAPFVTRRSLWTDSAYQQAVGEKFAKTSLASLKRAIGDPFDPQYPRWGQKYSVQLQEAIAGKKPVKEAFEKAANEAERITGGP